MPWWASIISLVGLPALKFALKLLEQKYPGLTFVIEEILKFLNGGGAIEDLHRNVTTFCQGAACPTELKK